MAERGGHGMVGKEKEKEMGEDEETDRQTRENIQGAERVITIPTHKTPNAV